MDATLLFGPLVFVGGLVLALMRRGAPAPGRAWLLDALLLFFIASIVCDAIALLPGPGMQLLVTPYALAAGFVAGIALRRAWQRRTHQSVTAPRA